MLAASLAGKDFAQDSLLLWTGLRLEQPDSLKPHGRAPFQVPVRREKVSRATTLREDGNGSWTILDGWELTDQRTFMEAQGALSRADYETDSGWYNAVVPGTVLTTLVENGVYPDPYFGLNNMSIPESLCRQEWWYRVVFDLPEPDAGGNVHLVLDGVNYRSEVYLNGRYAGGSAGAFAVADLDVSSRIRRFGNVLCIHVYPPSNPGIPHEQSIKAGGGANGGTLSFDGPTFISSIGWDWMPGIRDRNTGIWQNVRIKKYGGVKIGDVLVKTDLPIPDTTFADISVDVELVNLEDCRRSGTLDLRFSDRTVSAPYELGPGQTKTLRLSPSDYPALHMENPRLWWPNGYGAQALYELNLAASENGIESDAKSINFGVRELSYELMAHRRGVAARYLYTPNDGHTARPVFDYTDLRDAGGNVHIGAIREDADSSSLKRLPDDDKVGPYIVFRVNGRRIFCHGGDWGMDDAMKNCTREHLEPYFALHKAANFNMIRNWTGESTEEVFYDLCDRYGMLVWNDFWVTTDDTVEPNDVALFVENVRQVVRRFRNHPSIAVWCPRTEGYAQYDMADTLHNTIAREDPTRHYHGQSRFLNLRMSGPWGELRDRTAYFDSIAEGFTTEIGSISFPTARTIRKFIAPEDLWPINDVWAYHDLHGGGHEINAKVDSYGRAEGFDDYARKAQLICYESWRCIAESWNSRMWNSTTGLILWMSHPAWTSLRSQVYTSDCETPAAYFAVKKGFEKVHVQICLPDRKVMIVNKTEEELRGLSVEVACYGTDGRLLRRERRSASVGRNSASDVFVPDTEGLPDMYLMRTVLRDAHGRRISLNDYWVGADDGSNRAISMIPRAALSVRQSEGRVTVRNTSSAIAVAARLSAYGEDGAQILPALFSDGYFNLLPGESRVITFSTPFHRGKVTLKAEGYNL